MNGHKGLTEASISSPRGTIRTYQRVLFIQLGRTGHRLMGHLGTRELRRRLWHMSPGFLPFILWAIPHRDPISPTLRIIIISMIAGLGLRILWGFSRIRRHGESSDRGIGAVMGYALSVLACLLLFPGQAEISLGVLGILAFGDGSATFIGLVCRGKKLPWNPSKTWFGMVGFIVFGTLMSAIIYWGETHNLEARTPGVSFHTALLIAFLATLPAAVAESLDVRLNDNIRVGVTAAVCLASAHGWLVGWAG